MIDAIRIGILFEEVPCVACSVDDVVEDGDGEFVAAQIFPDIFDGIEFGSIGRQVQKSDVMGYAESARPMIAGTVEDEDGMCVGCDLAADGIQMQRHGLSIGRRHNQACCDAALRTGGAKEIGPVVTSIARRPRPRVPRLAQTRVSAPCWPIRASSWNQISIGLPLACSGSRAVTVAAKFF